MRPLPQTECDLAVIGGGPGGAACALAAAREGLRVTLFEPQTELGEKPCGEGLMPPGVDALRALGLDEIVAEGRPFERLRHVVGRRAPLELTLPRSGLAIERPRLVHALASALATEARVTRVRARATVRREAGTGGFEIESRQGTLRSRVLIAADGLHGKSAPWLRAIRTAPRPAALARIGVRARFLERAPLEAVEVRFDRGLEIYLTPLAGGRVNVAVLVRGGSADRGGAADILRRALDGDPEVAARLGERITGPEARVLGLVVPRTVAREASFLVGDACGGIDPVLGCGVTLALESGILAAQAARAIVDGDTSGRVERCYVEALSRRTRARRRLAAFLLALSEHDTLARGTVGVARLVPGLLEALVGVAAGGRESIPIRLAAG